MELRDYCDDDIWLTESLECDPNVMRDLGGPTPKERIPQIHARRLSSVLAKTVMYFTIIPDPDTGPIGTIGIWDSDWQGSKIKEMGWMILPAFQDRGFATAAGRMILDRAKTEENFSEVNAFPAVHNGASNSICRKLGFLLIGEVRVAYNGPPQPTNHCRWKVEF